MANIDPPTANIIAEAENNLVQEMTDFKIWPKMLPELRRHAMTYFDGETQFQYAQCSKLCNAEIQKVDKSIPSLLKIESLNKECTDVSIEMKLYNKQTRKTQGYEMKFINVDNNKHTWTVSRTGSTRVFQTAETSTYDGTAMDGALRHLDQRFKSRRINMYKFDIQIKFATWPDQFSNFLRRFYKANWKVYLSDGNYQGFMTFMEQNIAKTRLTLTQFDDIFNIPSSFFDSMLFKKVARFYCLMPVGITNEQFIESNATLLAIKTVDITSETVHQKIVALLNEPDTGKSFKINGTGQNWNRQVIVGDLPFQRVDDKKYTMKMDGGKIGTLIFHRYEMNFYTKKE